MSLSRALLLCCAAIIPTYAAAEEGYVFELQRTAKNADADSEGIWLVNDLAAYGSPPKHPDIYTARRTTPSGDWILTQTTGDCNLQTMCTTLLAHRKSGGLPWKVVANPQVQLGGSATLSLNYRLITTHELDQGAKPFIGRYEVEQN